MYTLDMTPLDVFKAFDAIRTGGHFVYTSGRHGSDYVGKDTVYPHTKATADLCCRIAHRFGRDRIEVVAAPAVGGTILSQWVAWHLCHWGSITGGDILATYAEKDKEGRFAFGRGYADLLTGKRVLVVEDVLTTGGSAAKVIAAVRAAGGEVIGLGALVNRGRLDAAALGLPKLEALLDLPLETWAADECPLCASGVPVNVEVGKGAEFLAKKTQAQNAATDVPEPVP